MPDQLPKIAAFFDLDRTLITVNSGRLWVASERREGRITPRQTVTAAVFFLAYRFGLLNMEKAMEQALALYRGKTEDLLRRRTERWFDAEVKAFAAPGAWPVIQRHRDQGHLLVLLTLSSPYASACAVDFFGLDHAISSRYQVEDGRFTGRFVTPLCYGPGKVALSQAFAHEHGVDLARSTFYTDSISDLEMLEAVGDPQVVNPDPRLRRLAKKRRWPISSWHEK